MGRIAVLNHGEFAGVGIVACDQPPGNADPMYKSSSNSTDGFSLFFAGGELALGTAADYSIGALSSEANVMLPARNIPRRRER